MKKRVLSAIVMIAILLPLFIIGSWPFKIAVGIIAFLAIKEVLDMYAKHSKIPTIIKVVSILLLVLIVYIDLNSQTKLIQICSFLIITLLVPSIFTKKEEYSTSIALSLISWILILGFFFHNVINLAIYNKSIFIYLLLITILNDTFAYIFGYLIGKHKLIEKVSPKKTWEGSLCGAILGTFVSTMYYYNVVGPTLGVLNIILMSIVLSIISQLGDLFFSKVKREHNIKDFSNLIPGHGGVLDRLDSLIYVVIVFTILSEIL